MPSETEKAWSAGIIDGEACLKIVFPGKKSSKLVVHVAQVLDPDRPGQPPRMLEALRDLWGGQVYMAKKPTKKNYSPYAQWHVVCRQAENLLREVRPYVVAKASQVEVCLRYRRRFGGPRTTRQSISRFADFALSEELIALRGGGVK